MYTHIAAVVIVTVRIVIRQPTLGNGLVKRVVLKVFRVDSVEVGEEPGSSADHATILVVESHELALGEKLNVTRKVRSRKLLFYSQCWIAQWLQHGTLFGSFGLGVKDQYFTQDAPVLRNRNGVFVPKLGATIPCGLKARLTTTQTM